MYEFCHNMETMKDRITNLRELKRKGNYNVNFPYVKGKHIEHEIILDMTDKNPDKRPSAQNLLKDYIPKWN